MHRVTRPVWLALLLLAIGLAAAILWESSGCLGRRPTGGEGRDSSPAAASIDTGDASLRGAGLLAEGERGRSNDRPRDVVKAEPPVSMDPAGPGEVVGQVVDPEGESMVAQVVFIPDGKPTWFATQSTTDAAGRFRLRTRYGVTDAIGAVALTRPHGRTSPLTPARTGGPALRVVASPARKARISVIDEEGRPLALARVRLGLPYEYEVASRVDLGPWISRGETLVSTFLRQPERFTDRAGLVTVEQLPIATHAVLVAPPLDRDLSPATFLGWDGGDATIRMTARPRVEGSVREAGGGLLTDGMVLWRRSGTEEWKDVRVEYDGTFSIDCGDTGAIELCPRMRNAFPRTPIASHVVPSGTTNVVLMTEAGPTLDVRLAGWIEEARGSALLIREPADAKGAPEVWLPIDDGRVIARGLDPKARYTLWVPPLSLVPGQPIDANPFKLCVLRTGLAPSAEPVEVPLAATQFVAVRFEPSEGTGVGWAKVHLLARGHGVALELPFHGFYATSDTGAEDLGSEPGADSAGDVELRIQLPPGKFLLRVEAQRILSKEPSRKDGRFQVLPYAGEVVWETGIGRVAVPLAPSSREPIPLTED